MNLKKLAQDAYNKAVKEAKEQGVTKDDIKFPDFYIDEVADIANGIDLEQAIKIINVSHIADVIDTFSGGSEGSIEDLIQEALYHAILNSADTW